MIPLGSRAASRAVRCRRGGVCLFRHRTALKARRRTRATTSCRGGCRRLAELLFESLGARGGSQSPDHTRQTGPKRLATRRGGTRPTGVQYFSDRGEKCARLSCTHAAASLAIVRGHLFNAARPLGPPLRGGGPPPPHDVHLNRDQHCMN